MSIPTMVETKKKTTQAVTSPRSLISQRRSTPALPVENMLLSKSCVMSGLGHDLSQVSIHPSTTLAGNGAAQPVTQSCPLASTGPRACPFGGACHTCPTQAQAKLAIGQPSDLFEREADQVAELVMRMPEPMVRLSPRSCGTDGDLQRKCASCSEDEEQVLQAKRSPGQRLAIEGCSLAPPIVEEVLRSPGQPLDASARAFTEPRFGHDFSQVRIHADVRAAASARAVNALAYTVGRDVVFAEGQYAPQTTEGRRLLVHELTHTMQQQGNSAPCGGVLQRAISRELDKIESLLSYGIFDWAITDEEAIEALELLKRLPKYQQAVFFSDEKYVSRLRDNLPGDRLSELNDLEARVADIIPPQPEVKEISSRLSYGLFDWVVTDKEAIEALERLKKLPDAKLAVALGAVNYERLMDNLPASRKQELIDLVARVSPATGGLAETGVTAPPGSMLNAVTFTSDHGIMKDNMADWGTSGKLFGEPEWFIKDGNEVSRPISQTMGTNIETELNLNLLPATANLEPITIEGQSTVDFLTFRYSGMILGGLARRISMISSGSLPTRIKAYYDLPIRWKITWLGSKHEFVPVAGHTIFVTMNRPLEPEEVTYKRMAKAVEIVQQLNTLEPYEIVKGIFQNWNNYTLATYRDNPWELADLPGGADCITIVRYALAILKMVGCPGEAEAHK